MNYLVSITSQGQISIPSQLRKELGLSEHKKALVKKEGRRIVVEPIDDLLYFEGALAHKAIKGKSINEIIKLEKKAWERETVKRYLKTFK